MRRAAGVPVTVDAEPAKAGIECCPGIVGLAAVLERAQHDIPAELLAQHVEDLAGGSGPVVGEGVGSHRASLLMRLSRSVGNGRRPDSEGARVPPTCGSCRQPPGSAACPAGTIPQRAAEPREKTVSAGQSRPDGSERTATSPAQAGGGGAVLPEARRDGAGRLTRRPLPGWVHAGAEECRAIGPAGREEVRRRPAPGAAATHSP